MKKRNLAGIDIVIYCIACLVLIILKVANILKWDWIWIFAPIWAPAGAMILIVIVILIWSFIEQKVKNE